MAKKFDLTNYKKSIETADTPKKKNKFIVLDECLHPVIGVPGFPLGHINQIFGKSDTGKTSLMFHAAAKAQLQKILPILIITEGKVDWNRARAMGFKYTGDIEAADTSEDFCIVEENLDFIEDVGDYIDKIISDVSMGNLPHDVMIFWDSVGNTLSKEEVEIKSDGTWEKKATMMKAAKVISGMMRVLSKKINDTRKISYPKSVGLTILNQAYTKPPAFPGGQPSLIPYGGDAIWFRSSLVLKMAKFGKLEATIDKIKKRFGIIAKITVDKNHLTDIANSGNFVITADCILPNDKEIVKEYKETHKENWGNLMYEELNV